MNEFGKRTLFTLACLATVLCARKGDVSAADNAGRNNAGRNNAGQIVVAMKADSRTVDHSTVQIKDIASVLGGGVNERGRIQSLDLDSIQQGQPCVVSRKQIQMRMLLAGFQRADFVVSGPESVTLHRFSITDLRTELERQIAIGLRQQFGLSGETVVVRIANETVLKGVSEKLGSGVITASPHPQSELPIGRSRMLVDVSSVSGGRMSIPLDVNTSVMMELAIAKQPIPRGTTVTANMVRTVHREVSRRADYVVPAAAVGNQANRYVAVNAILLAGHFSSQSAAQLPVVKRNDLLDVVVSLPIGEIRLKNAKAMENGRVGDTIEILNPKTDRRINATIVGPNLARLPSTSRSLR